MLDSSPKPIRGIAELVGKKRLADTIYEFRFKMVTPDVIEFLPGQYIAIEIDKTTRRQYSISTSPTRSDTEFEIVLDVIPNGIGVNYLMKLNQGDRVNFIGQIGLFTLPIDLAESLFFIATGSGLAPLKSMVETLIDEEMYKQHSVNLYFGTRYPGDIFYDDLFNEYFNKGLINEYRICLSRASLPGAMEGYVTQFVEFYPDEQLQDSQFFLCGSGSMIKSVEHELLRLNVPNGSIYYEKFY